MTGKIVDLGPRLENLTRHWLSWLAVLVIIVPPSFGGPPPPPPINTPGPSQGLTRSRWLVPYVRELLEGAQAETDGSCCCGPGHPLYRWYLEDGRVDFELSGDQTHAGSGYVAQSIDSTNTYFGLIPRWRLQLEQKGVRDRTIAASPTGQTFLHEYYPDSLHVAVDVYLEGALERTLGPYPSGGWDDRIEIEEDGAFSFSMAGSDGSGPRTVVLVGSEGQFTMQIPSDARSIRASPSGRCAVIRDSNWTMTILGDNSYDAPIGSSALTGFLLWANDEQSVLLSNYVGQDAGYMSVDRRTGRILWEFQASDDQRPHHREFGHWTGHRVASLPRGVPPARSIHRIRPDS